MPSEENKRWWQLKQTRHYVPLPYADEAEYQRLDAARREARLAPQRAAGIPDNLAGAERTMAVVRAGLPRPPGLEGENYDRAAARIANQAEMEASLAAVGLGPLNAHGSMESAAGALMQRKLQLAAEEEARNPPQKKKGFFKKLESALRPALGGPLDFLFEGVTQAAPVLVGGAVAGPVGAAAAAGTAAHIEDRNVEKAALEAGVAATVAGATPVVVGTGIAANAGAGLLTGAAQTAAFHPDATKKDLMMGAAQGAAQGAMQAAMIPEGHVPTFRDAMHGIWTRPSSMPRGASTRQRNFRLGEQEFNVFDRPSGPYFAPKKQPLMLKARPMHPIIPEGVSKWETPYLPRIERTYQPHMLSMPQAPTHGSREPFIHLKPRAPGLYMPRAKPGQFGYGASAPAVASAIPGFLKDIGKPLLKEAVMSFLGGLGGLGGQAGSAEESAPEVQNSIDTGMIPEFMGRESVEREEEPEAPMSRREFYNPMIDFSLEPYKPEKRERKSKKLRASNVAAKHFNRGGYVQHGDSEGDADDVDTYIPEGSYVMNATDVSLYGNGYSENGAKKLHEMEQQILSSGRKHIDQFAPHHKPVHVNLSNGEYVLHPHTVSIIGGGDNKRGAKIISKARKELRKQKGVKQILPPKAKPIATYLKGGSVHVL